MMLGDLEYHVYSDSCSVSMFCMLCLKRMMILTPRVSSRVSVTTRHRGSAVGPRLRCDLAFYPKSNMAMVCVVSMAPLQLYDLHVSGFHACTTTTSYGTFIEFCGNTTFSSYQSLSQNGTPSSQRRTILQQLRHCSAMWKLIKV